MTMFIAILLIMSKKEKRGEESKETENSIEHPGIGDESNKSYYICTMNAIQSLKMALEQCLMMSEKFQNMIEGNAA